MLQLSRKAAGELVEECERPGELNQALMELGATMCTVQVCVSVIISLNYEDSNLSQCQLTTMDKQNTNRIRSAVDVQCDRPVWRMRNRKRARRTALWIRRCRNTMYAQFAMQVGTKSGATNRQRLVGAIIVGLDHVDVLPKWTLSLCGCTFA